jgi:hypothetical protein
MGMTEVGAGMTEEIDGADEPAPYKELKIIY